MNLNVSQINYGLIKENNFIVMYTKIVSHIWTPRKMGVIHESHV